ncbi:hypothetical protein DPMN_042028 [Dreissena polymorpha]|uniref:Uncharacterized protein n=1 Tax=Dreissena polymorpha TaxID=45954 RepID=A0A9D4CYT6_DREPO|nr:hypothetical protein DPMN_042028 [Dreissena polymorpha]
MHINNINPPLSLYLQERCTSTTQIPHCHPTCRRDAHQQHKSPTVIVPAGEMHINNTNPPVIVPAGEMHINNTNPPVIVPAGEMHINNTNPPLSWNLQKRCTSTTLIPHCHGTCRRDAHQQH